MKLEFIGMLYEGMAVRVLKIDLLGNILGGEVGRE
jgi:hypothetical protein